MAAVADLFWFHHGLYFCSSSMCVCVSVSLSVCLSVLLSMSLHWQVTTSFCRDLAWRRGWPLKSTKTYEGPKSSRRSHNGQSSNRTGNAFCCKVIHQVAALDEPLNRTLDPHARTAAGEYLGVWACVCPRFQPILYVCCFSNRFLSEH